MIIESYNYQGSENLVITKRVNGEKVRTMVEKFQPYFFIKKSDLGKVKCNYIDNNMKDIFGNDVVKVISESREQKRSIMDALEITYEADIRTTNRYLIDTDQDFGDKPKFVYLDIEVDSHDGKFPEPHEVKYPVTSISLINGFKPGIYVTLFFRKDFTEQKVKCKIQNRVTGKEQDWVKYYFSNEQDLLNKFIDLFVAGDFDIGTGWNSDFFDFVYLINRCKKLKLQIERISPFNSCEVPAPTKNFKTGKTEFKIPKIKGKRIFDLLIPYKKINTREMKSYSLGNVGKEELGVDKLDYVGNLHELYLTDPEKYMLYNIYDVELAYEIDKKLAITDYFWDLSKFIGCELGDTMSNSRMGDFYSLKYCKSQGKVLPTKRKTQREEFEGATVIDPEKGHHKNVLVLDLSKFYPQIIISCNMSPETVVNSPTEEQKKSLIQLGNGMYFRKDIKGFSSSVLVNLFKIENEKKKIMKEVAEKFGYNSPEYKRATTNRQFVKDLRNSFYGLLSYPGFRLYVPNVGASVTYVGRKCIEFCKTNIEAEGHRVIYGDSDSIFVEAKDRSIEKVVEYGKQMEKLLNEKFNLFAKNMNIEQHGFAIEFEKVYGSLILFAKKKYDAVMTWFDGKEVSIRDTKGLESKRSDSSKITIDLFNDIFNMIHDNKSREEIEQYIKNIIKRVLTADLEEIGIPKAIKENLDEYKSTAAWIRGAQYSRDNLGINLQKGDKPYFIYVVSGKGYPFTDAVCFNYKEQVPAEFKVNYSKMLDILVMKKVERIFEVMQWHDFNLSLKIKDGQVTFIEQQILGGY